MKPFAPRALALLGVLLALALAVVPAAAAPAAQQGAQRILIESPPAGTQVGSPVVITGSLAQLPASASLSYVVLASDGRQIGGGSFPIPGTPGQPAYFIASLTFDEPLDGDSITLQVLDIDPASGGVLAVVTLPLVTAPVPQRIVIDTPPAGTQVGNPVVVTGRTVRFPPSGVLGYAIYDAGGAQVGGGVFPVEGSPLVGGSFAASLPFVYPTLGGPLRIDLYDQDPATLAFLATASFQTVTAALVQQLTVETPVFGTQIGTPVTITGRATIFPAEGALQYEIFDGRGVSLGAGSFPVEAAAANAARFTASISFTPPAAPGPVRIRVVDPATGVASPFAELVWGS
jgi:hypothetical protein